MDVRIPALVGLTVSGLLFAATAGTDAPLTVDAAVAEARANNPDVRRLEARADAAGWRRAASFSGYLPHLSVEATHLFDAKYARLNVVFNGNPVGFPSAVPQDNIFLTASLNVFDGFATFNNYRAASLEKEAAEHDMAALAFKLDREVRLRFQDFLAASALRDVADQNIGSLEEHLSLARATERSGMGTRFNVLRLEAQLEEARAEKTLAEDNVTLARTRLSLAMGRETADERAVDGALPVPVADDAVRALTPDVSAREDLQADRARESAFDRRAAAANAMWFPKISLYAQEQLYKFGGFDPVILPNSSLQNAHTIGVSLKWDFFDGGESFAKRQEAAARAREAAAATRADVQRELAELETWKRKYLYNSALYRARLRTIEKANESVRLAKLGLRAGTSTHSEVLDAELDLFRARAGVVRAQADAAEALLRLELATGKAVAAR